MELKDVDINFDVRRDSQGKDPDSASAMLKAYHALLWSKPLPNGQSMSLLMEKGCYLRWKDMYFGSDSIIISFNNSSFKMLNNVKAAVADYNSYREEYLRKACTIAGYIIFPQMKWSINQARGCGRHICDRFDLTLECIRRFYDGEESPLFDTLEKNRAFFELFVNFNGYVNFFFLQDNIDEHGNVKLWMDTPLWDTDPMPRSVEEYFKWIDTELDFVSKRGKRILQYIKESR